MGLIFFISKIVLTLVGIIAILILLDFVRITCIDEFLAKLINETNLTVINNSSMHNQFSIENLSLRNYSKSKDWDKIKYKLLRISLPNSEDKNYRLQFKFGFAWNTIFQSWQKEMFEEKTDLLFEKYNLDKDKIKIFQKKDFSNYSLKA